MQALNNLLPVAPLTVLNRFIITLACRAMVSAGTVSNVLSGTSAVPGGNVLQVLANSGPPVYRPLATSLRQEGQNSADFTSSHSTEWLDAITHPQSSQWRRPKVCPN